MNHGYLLLATVVLITGISGCTGPGGSYNGPGLFSNVNGARIAPPATGTVQYPQQASLPDPYYGGTPTPAAGGAQGWRPAGTTTNTNNLANYNPSSQNIQAVPRNTIPANNLVVATSTSGIQPRGTANNGTLPSVTIPPGVATTAVAGGMPLTDATRVATMPAQPNTGIFNRTWEYVARPNAPNYPAAPYQYATQPQPVYANGTIVASSSTAPGYAVPRPTSYSYQNGFPGYQNVNPANNVIADGWRQRDVAR